MILCGTGFIGHLLAYLLERFQAVVIANEIKNYYHFCCWLRIRVTIGDMIAVTRIYEKENKKQKKKLKPKIKCGITT